MTWTEILHKVSHACTRISSSLQHPTLAYTKRTICKPLARSSWAEAWIICKHLGLQSFYFDFLLKHKITEISNSSVV